MGTFEGFYSASFILGIFPKDFFHLISLSVYLTHQSVFLFFFSGFSQTVLPSSDCVVLFITCSKTGTQQSVSLVVGNTEFPPLSGSAILKQVSCWAR